MFQTKEIAFFSYNFRISLIASLLLITPASQYVQRDVTFAIDKSSMSRRNTLRTLIASFLLMLATGTLMVKSVHCVLIPHDYLGISVVEGQVVISTGQTDSCLICSFDFFPVILHSLKVLPDVMPFVYTERLFCLAEAPIKQVAYLFLLRAPPVV
ncbi:MAG: hypothetical protein H6Q17_762 [Bacteroidetes bacterium]|nr:hypothetical protein [Bacteroidota bacterium]